MSDMSKANASELEIFPEYTSVITLVESLDTLWRPSIEDKGVIFTTHVDNAVPDRIKVDPLRLRQCINNLLSNAAKFTDNGRVHMHVTGEPIEGGDTITLNVIVADTGIGMDRPAVETLFQPFGRGDSIAAAQANPNTGDTGLSLAITRSLARMMDGDVTVKSRKGAGTEMTLRLETLAIYDAEIMDSVDAVFQHIDSEDFGAEDFGPEDFGEPEAMTPNAAETRGNTLADIVIPEASAAAPNAGLNDILGLTPNDYADDDYADDGDTGNGDAGYDDAGAQAPIDNAYDLIQSAAEARGTHDIAIQPPSRPARAADTPPISPPAEIDEANIDSLENLRVLIVEDVPSNHDVMKIFLEPQGCLVMGAENGLVAVTAAGKQEFDVILMDIRMPEMNGIEATKAIRARGGLNAHVPIIALTADATAENNAQCMAAGADIFLTKPIIATELYDAIRFVRRQALRRAIRAGRQPTPIVRIEDDRRSA